ncbi:MAG: hypothetical protein HYZ53_07925 [Planctomycetes bacterium]|nr:hypothetical protein [Planctomycetota bacterium]
MTEVFFSPATGEVEEDGGGGSGGGGETIPLGQLGVKARIQVTFDLVPSLCLRHGGVRSPEGTSGTGSDTG